MAAFMAVKLALEIGLLDIVLELWLGPSKWWIHEDAGFGNLLQDTKTLLGNLKIGTVTHTVQRI